jgi:hypothetical protein
MTKQLPKQQNNFLLIAWLPEENAKVSFVIISKRLAGLSIIRRCVCLRKILIDNILELVISRTRDLIDQ